MKEKIFKILHVIGYISMALLTLILLVVGVNSCNNTEPQHKEKQNINYALREEVDTLYRSGEEVGYNLSVNSYGNGNMTPQELILFFEDYLVNFNRTGVNAYQINLAVTRNGTLSTIISWKSVAKLNITETEFYVVYDFVDANDNPVYSLNSTFILSSDSFSISLTPYSNFEVKKDIFKYLKIMQFMKGDTFFGSLDYFLAPYLTIKQGTKDFYVDMGFRYQGFYCYALEYKQEQYLRFYSEQHSNGYLTFSVIPTISGDSYFYRFGTNTTGDMIVSKELEIVVFGSKGFETLEKYFVNTIEPRISGRFVFSDKSIYEYLSLFGVVGTETNIIKYINFKSNELTYFGIKINYFIDAPSVGAWAIRINCYYLSSANRDLLVYEGVLITSEGGFHDLENGEVQVFGNLTENFVITMDNSLYSNDTAFLLNFVFVPYGVLQDTSTGGNVYTDLFDLIGSGIFALVPIFDIYILPGITLGILFFIPLIISLILTAIWLFKR